MSKWDELTMAEKAEMMKVAVRNGITKLQDIRDKYNEFAEGGELEANTFKGGGYKPSDSVKKRISTWEGAAMTGAIDPLSGKWGKNRSFKAEADSFYDALPASIRSQVLSNPELADNLFSYSYNVGAGNFKKRVVPALEKYYTGNGSPKEIANSMWATGDKKLRGLRNRRAVERKGVVDALTPAFVSEPADNTFMPNPFAIQMENTYQRPIIVPDEGSYVTAHEVSPSEQRAQKVRESFDAINKFNALMNMLNMGTTAPTYTPDTGNPFLDAIGVLANSNANGGKIHIKPENRGKFTALKKRTGHSATWFKQHGTSAQKKMATFALNARKWKHGFGGNLFSGEEQGTQQMISKTATPEENVFSSFIVRASEDPMVNMAKQNPEFSSALAKIYETEDTEGNPLLSKEQADRLFEVYKKAGSPSIRPLSKSPDISFNKERRAYSVIRAGKWPFIHKIKNPLLYVDESNLERGLNQTIAELSHFIQEEYGNNNPAIEWRNPYYNGDDYRDRTRYDYPNKFESETHMDFEPMLKSYILKDTITGQKLAEKVPFGTSDTIPHPTLQQVIDSTRTYNKRKVENDFIYDGISTRIPVEGNWLKKRIKDWF